MILFRSHSEIDKEKWDACIRESANGMIYGYSWYLDIVSPGWAGLIEDAYTAVFPLTQRKKFGLQYLHQPFFTQQLGLFSKQENNPSQLQEFLNSIPSIFRLIEIQLNVGNTFPLQIKGAEFNKRITHHLELNKTKSAAVSNYSENLKRNIRKAEKSKLKIDTSIQLEQIIEMFRATRGKNIETLHDKDYQTLTKLVKVCERDGKAELLGAQMPDGKFIAGAVFLKSLDSYIFLFSATLPEGRDTGAMSALLDGFIERHLGEAMILDFEGSMDPNLARFYKSFGSKEVVYLQFRKNKLPPLIRWLKHN